MTRSLNGGLRCDDGHQLGYEVSQKRRRATATLADGMFWVHRPHTPFASSRTSCLLPTSSCDTRHDARLSVHETRHEQSYEPSNIPVTCSSVHAHTYHLSISSLSPGKFTSQADGLVYLSRERVPRRTRHPTVTVGFAPDATSTICVYKFSVVNDKPSLSHHKPQDLAYDRMVAYTRG